MLLRTILLSVTVAVTWGRRVPKVYNALITSGDNLAPSKAYPVFQPVIHETAFGIPLQPTFVYGGDPFKDFVYHPYPLDSAAEKTDTLPSVPAQKEKTPDATKPQASDKLESIPEANPSRETPPEKPAQEGPIKLNEFGLPPSLIPVQPYNPATLPYSYTPYNNFYPELYSSPAFSPYNLYPGFPLSPYPFPGYPFPSHNAPIPEGTFLQQPEGAGGPQAAGASLPGEEPKQPAAPGISTAAPSDLDIKNNSNKQPGVPDVPPPPLPKGGLKYDTNKA